MNAPPQTDSSHAHPRDPDREALEYLRASLGEEFDIVRMLGRGTMARVYLAKDRALGVLQAIKVLRSAHAGDETVRLRFEREARAAASLSEHTHVVAVHRFGRLPDETPYLVMQYVKGRTMEERLKAEGRLPVAEARSVLVAVASALEEAHRKGILHRDLRPANVLWDEERQRALLTDFGIAALLVTSGEDAAKLTVTGQLLGDPRYLSPEQLRDEELTELADVYLLGVLGYELLTGEGPYEATSNMDWITAHMRGEPRDLTALRPDCDADLADLLRRCLSREPKHRPSTADVRKALERTGGEAIAPAVDNSGGLLKRRLPQIVGAAVAASAGMIGVASDLQGDGRLPSGSVDVALASSVALVLAASVVGWFHGEKGKQAATTLEYVLLGVIGVTWLAVSGWIIVAN